MAVSDRPDVTALQLCTLRDLALSDDQGQTLKAALG